MATSIRQPDNRVSVNGAVARKISDGDVTLDALAIPYGVATVIHDLQPDDTDDADPRSDIRAVLTCSGDGGQTTRQFDLGVRARDIDHVAKTVELTLATDEALAMDHATLARDTNPRTYEKSLRAVCDYVLGKVAGINRNWHPNPNLVSDLTGYSPSSASIVLSWGATGGVKGEGCGVGTITLAATGGTAVYGTSYDVAAGETWTISVYIRSHIDGTTVGRSANMRIVWLDGPGGTVSGVSQALTTTYARITVTATVPAGVTKMRPDIHMPTWEPITSGKMVWDQFMVERSTNASPYRDVVLAPGTVDADVTAYWAVTNEVTNPGIEVDLTGWTTGGNATSLVRTTAQFYEGGASATWSSNASGDSYIMYSGVRVRAGASYVVTSHVRASAAVQGRAYVRWKNDAGVTVKDSQTTQVSIPASTWTRLTGVFVAPPGAVTAQILVIPTATAAGQSFWADAIMFHEGTEGVPWFNGSTPDDAIYTYSWGQAANATPSIREPAVSRPPEMFIWQPGTTAWDFLAPFLAQSGLRLFCDEARVWRLIDPRSYLLSGSVRVTGTNATSGVDKTSRWDAEVFATGVVARYRWTDGNGITQVAFDTAGTSQKVFVVDYERPFPGPGAAAAILARRDGTGRVQAVTGLIDWVATPAMTAVIVLPFTAEQQGKVSSIAFALGDAATMDVVTAGLIEIPAGAIDALDGTIDGLVGTIDSLNPIVRNPIRGRL